MARNLTYQELLDDRSHMQLLYRLECRSLFMNKRQLQLVYYDLQTTPPKYRVKNFSDVRDVLEVMVDENMLDMI